MRAMILCAGFGSRLGDLTKHIPKPMLRIGDRPILAYIINNIARHGYNKIVINLHYHAKMISDYFGNGDSFGVKIYYSFEEELLGTAGAVKKMEDFFGEEEEFLVHYGDVLTNQDYTEMLSFHRIKKSLATLLLHQRLNSNSIVDIDSDNKITKFIERPPKKILMSDTPNWVNSGIYICNREILKIIPDGCTCDFPKDIFQNHIDQNRFFGYPLSGIRYAIDSQERLEEAQIAVKNGWF
jgi:NDP-sugar pyrophosphorylase family protein